MPAPNSFTSDPQTRPPSSNDIHFSAHAGRPAGAGPARAVIGVLLFLLCAALSSQFGKYLWDNAQPSLFISAARQGDLARVKSLLAGNHRLLDTPAYAERTALWWAAATGHTEILQYLIEQKADLARKDAQGWTAMHAAAARNQVAAMKVLAQYDGAVGVPDNRGRTEMHAAAAGRNIEAVAFLFAQGESIDAPDATGWTPLHVAVAAALGAKDFYTFDARQRSLALKAGMKVKT